MVASYSRPTPPTAQNVAVVLEINGGSFDDGFSVKIRILEDGRTIQEDDDFPTLPAAPEMPNLYQAWQNNSLDNSRKLQAVPAQTTNIEGWRQTAKKLEEYCRNWFQNHAFKSLREAIRANARVSHDQSVPIIIRCQTPDNRHNDILRRLPWHNWDLFSFLPNAEFALLTGFHPSVPKLSAPVRVLAIFGSSQGGLELEEDAAALKMLEQRGAQIIRHSQPTEEQLTDLLCDGNWDILFFAGHTASEGTNGKIQIREGNFLPLDALRQSLTKAVSRGLKLAIFNSCDGLGIADFLASLVPANVPTVIVMREPVPDQIAYKFLLYFLREFSQGKPLCLAVREARNRLEGLQGTFPAASWLPVVCLNPNQPELVWPAPSKLSFLLRHRLILGLAAIAGILTLAAIVHNNQCQIFATKCMQSVDSSNDQPLNSAVNIDNFISAGERPITNSRIRLSEPYLSLKQQGIKAFAQGRYADAIANFDKLPTRITKDPESLIFRNNAMVKSRQQQNTNLPIYTIAVAAPLNDNAGIDMLFGIAQAQDVAVKQGINLQVVIANDLNQPEQARNVARKLSENPEILAVVGHFTSPNTCAALNIYSPNHLVVISPTSTLVKFRANPDCGSDIKQIFFRTTSSSLIEARSLVEYLVKPDGLNKPKPKVVVFYNSKESFSKDLFAQFSDVFRDKEFDGQIIATFDLSDPNFDVKQLPIQVKNADAIVLLPDGGTNNNIALQRGIKIIQLNNGEKPILGANTLYLQRVINETKNSTVNRLFLADDWHPKLCGAREFTKEVRDYWGGDLNSRTALSYEAIQAILQAIQLSGKFVNREQIRQKLADTANNPETAAASATVKGLKIRFDNRGDRQELSTQAIFTVNQQLKFDIVKNVPLPDGSCP